MFLVISLLGEEEEKGEETDEMEEGAADFDQSEPIADTFEDSVREADDSEQVRETTKYGLQGSF